MHFFFFDYLQTFLVPISVFFPVKRRDDQTSFKLLASFISSCRKCHLAQMLPQPDCVGWKQSCSIWCVMACSCRSARSDLQRGKKLIFFSPALDDQTLFSFWWHLWPLCSSAGHHPFFNASYPLQIPVPFDQISPRNSWQPQFSWRLYMKRTGNAARFSLSR